MTHCDVFIWMSLSQICVPVLASHSRLCTVRLKEVLHRPSPQTGRDYPQCVCVSDAETGMMLRKMRAKVYMMSWQPHQSRKRQRSERRKTGWQKRERGRFERESVEGAGCTALMLVPRCGYSASPARLPAGVDASVYRGTCVLVWVIMVV